ncbi:hypothetical protein ABH040_18870, partial [Bacteroides thetaiotaomicron]|uniref:hypothetical protein n=2 Tax=Bacteroides TaxID=816 RepID=UPI003260CBE3
MRNCRYNILFYTCFNIFPLFLSSSLFVSTPLSVGFSYAKVQRSSGIKHRRANGSWIARKPSQIRDVLSVPR